jgi:DNA-(apurinic or apyrimidinic site) lyase
MLILRDDLSVFLKQKKEAKTIVFAVKMFSYSSRICFKKLIYFPYEINIPIDSRLKKIFERNLVDKSINLDLYYKKLAVKLSILELHLDAILWNSPHLNYPKGEE